MTPGGVARAGTPPASHPDRPAVMTTLQQDAAAMWPCLPRVRARRTSGTMAWRRGARRAPRHLSSRPLPCPRAPGVLVRRATRHARSARGPRRRLRAPGAGPGRAPPPADSRSLTTIVRSTNARATRGPDTTPEASGPPSPGTVTPRYSPHGPDRGHDGDDPPRAVTRRYSQVQGRVATRRGAGARTCHGPTGTAPPGIPPGV